MSDDRINVSLGDLALILYLPKPSVDPETGACRTCGEHGGAHYCAPREAARLRLEAIVQSRIDAAIKKVLTTPAVRRPPTPEQIETARERLAPYINGYPTPMIDTRYMRVANGTATQEEMDAVAAEEIVWAEVRAARGQT